MKGTFFAVVGPSGAGKDTVIDHARAALQDDSRFTFPTRCITRPADAGGERHQAVTDEEFLQLKAKGGFLIDWDAHGLRYGVPSGAREQIEAGVSAVVNLSRGAVAPLRALVPRVHVVLVTASPEVISARLAERGRETADEIEKRIARAADDLPADIDVTIIRNDGAARDAGDALVELLLSRHGPAARA